MRPLTFQNLRRLVSRKKDRNEPSFKRSESFKRISIRKSYLDRGKRRNRFQKNLEPVVNSSSQQVTNDKTVNQQIKEQEFKKDQKRSLSRDSITYDEWLQGVSSSSREKLHEDHLESLQHPKPTKTTKFVKYTDTDSVIEDLKILELDTSPVLTPKSKSFGIVTEIGRDQTTNGHDTFWIQESSVEGSLSVNISLGRIWRDAVPFPVSIPLSTPSYSSVSNSLVHHYLDSALKEKKPQPTVTRTVSAPEKPVSKETSSSFGFSLRIARFADFRPGMTRHGLFRRKTPKPSPSVSTEGYFKRTSASRHSSSRRRSGKRTSQRANKKNQKPAVRINSPVWFIPPERRRSRRQRRVWQEIRYFPDDESPILERINDWSSNVSDDQFDDQKLLLSGDFNERREDDALNSIVSSSFGSFSATSSSSSACLVQKISDFNEDKLFSEELRTNGLLVRGATWKLSATTTTMMSTPARTIISGNYFASSQFLTFLAKDIVKEKPKNESFNTSYKCLSSPSSESEDDDVDRFSDRKRNFPQRQQHLKRQKSGFRRRPLRRKSQLRKASAQPVFLVRKCSSLRKHSSKIRI